jgi:predicted Zn-dependent peptidase
MIPLLSLFFLPTAADRVLPPAGIVVPRPVPIHEEHALNDGSRLLFLQVPDVRRVEVQFSWDAGLAELCPDRNLAPCKALAELQMRGTTDQDATAVEVALDLLDARAHPWMEAHRSGVNLSIPREHLWTGLSLLHDLLSEPALPEIELRRYASEQHKADRIYAQNATDPLQERLLGRLLHADDDPAGWDTGDWQRVDREQVEAAHMARLGQFPLTVLVAGDLPLEHLIPRLRKATAGLAAPGRTAPLDRLQLPTEHLIHAVDLPGAPQTRVGLLLPADGRSDPARNVHWKAISHTLTDAFGSRMNLRLRETEGLTYGSWGGWWPGGDSGLFTVMVDVPAGRAAEAVKAIESELHGLQSGLRADELESARVTAYRSINSITESPASAVSTLWARILWNETAATKEAEVAAWGALGPDDLAPQLGALADPTGPRLWVFIGDRGELEPQLQRLGWTTVWHSPAELCLPPT